MTWFLRALVLAFGVAFAAVPALAHETTRSHLAITRSGTTIEAHLRVAFRDVAVLIWMDADLDGALTWAEVTAHLPEISAYALARIDLQAGGTCRLRLDRAGASSSGSIGYLDLRFRGQCPDAAAPMSVTSRLLDDIDPDHRLFLTSAASDRPVSAVLSRSSPDITLPSQDGGLAETLRSYGWAGIVHLLEGPDHIAFLLLLILPAVAGTLAPRAAAVQIFTSVTGFTLAHALTLSAATLTFLRPPPDLIGGLVAATVILTAIDNLRPFLPGPRAAAAALFGLIHGFGFASILAETALDGPALVAALFAFNLGIEAGQVIVVLSTAFALAALRGGRTLLVVGSGLGLVAGGWWLWNAVLRIAGS